MRKCQSRFCEHRDSVFHGLIGTFISKSEWISYFCNELLAPTLNYLLRSGMQGSRTSGKYCSTICNIRTYNNVNGMAMSPLK
jgi:hypothetical protein